MADGWTALHYAAMNGFANIVDLLVQSGADVNCTDKFHRNALHWACRFNNLRMMEKLLNHDIRHDYSDIEKQTPMDLSVRFQNKEAEEYLRDFVKQKRMKQMMKKEKKTSSVTKSSTVANVSTGGTKKNLLK